MTEVAINVTLKNKLDELSSKHILPSTKNIPLYVYNIDDKRISKDHVLFKSMQKTCATLGMNIASIILYINTPVPYRGKLFFTEPIIDFNRAFEIYKLNTPKGLVNRVLPTKLLCYGAKIYPLPSLLDAANYFSVNYRTIPRHLDTILATTQ